MRPDIKKPSEVIDRILYLYDVEGLTFKAIGERLGFRGNTIGVNYKKAKAALEAKKKEENENG